MKGMYTNSNDRDLLRAAQNGDPAAFGCLFEKYWHDLFMIACRRLHSAEDAKDLVQDVFLSLWNNIKHVSAGDTLGGYLYTSLRNKIFNHLEKNNTRLHKLLNRPFNAVESEAQAYINCTTKEIQQFIHYQVNEMPEKMRRIYLLSREENLTVSEIASLLSLSNQTVKNQLHNALKRLRDNLGTVKNSLLLAAVFIIRKII